MTTKPDHDNAGAPNPVGDKLSADGREPLPSVIVDPALNAVQLHNGERAGENDRTENSHGGEHAAGNGQAEAEAGSLKAEATLPEYGAQAKSVDLSPAEADGFAERFRPSWESLAPVHNSKPPVNVWDAGQSSMPAAAAAEVDSAELPTVTHFRRGLMMTAGAIAAFAALVALAFFSSRGSTLPPKATAAKVSAAAAPAEPAAPPPVQVEAAPPAAAPEAVAQPETTPTEPVNPGAEAAPGAAAPTNPNAAVEPAPAAAPVPAAAPPIGKEEPIAALAAAPVVAEPPAATPDAPPVKPPAPTLVRIHITTLPDNAELTLDGAAVPNPFDTGMPRSGRHRVHAVADGFHSREVTVTFNSDQELVLQLDPRQTAKAARTLPPAAPAAAKPRAARAPTARFTPNTPQRAPTGESAPKGAGFVTESPY